MDAPVEQPGAPDRRGREQTDELARRHTSRVIGAIAFVGLVLIGALWLAVFVQIRLERSTAIAHGRTEAGNLSAAFKEEVTRELDDVAGAMELVAERMRAAEGNFDIHDWARTIPLLSAPTIQAAIIAPNGMLLSTTLEAHPKPLDLSDREHFRVHFDGQHQGLFISKPVLGRVSGQVTIQVSRRVDAADGRVLGVIVFSIPPSHLTSLHKSIDLGTRGRLTLFGTDNIIRARFGVDTPNGTEGVGTLLPAGPQRNPSSDDQDVVHISAGAVDHVLRLYSDRHLVGYPLLVGVGLDLTNMLVPVQAQALYIEIIASFVSLLLFVLLGALIYEIKRRARNETQLAHERAELADDIVLRKQIEARLRNSEQRFRDIAEVGVDWIWETDADHRFTFVAGKEALAVISQTGLTPQSTLGKRRWELSGTNVENDENWRAHMADMDAHRPFRMFHYSVTAPSGAAHHIVVSGKPVHDGSGAFVGYRGTATDETAMVQTLQRAEQAEILLRDAVDSISEGFVIFDRHDRLVTCNEQYRKLYPEAARLMAAGATFEQILYAAVAGRSYPEAIGQEEAWLRERLQRHFDASGAIEVFRSDGTWIRATDRRMRNGGIAGLRVDITELKAVHEALHVSEERLDRAQEIAGVGSWELDVASRGYVWSKEMYRIRGVSPAEFQPSRNNLAPLMHADDFETTIRWLNDMAMGQQRGPTQLRIVRPNGEVRTVRVEGRPIKGTDGTVLRVAGTMQDITRQLVTERQLAQAQKMEAIGSLTGGMAHDFNNVLGVIIGNLDLLRPLLAENAAAEEVRAEALDGALRGTDLIHRLLAFARRQPLHPVFTNANRLVADLSKLLARVLGENIALTCHLDPDLWPIVIDPAQLEAALTNLATNSRDALPRGGSLEIRSQNVYLDEDYVAQYPEVAPGDYVMIQATDTGIGMTPEVVARAYEPFFTTKEQGRGSGLGLSMVFGFVKQSGGHISIYSEVGRGTSVRLYLPRALSSQTVEDGSTEETPLVGGTETILVVEDNAPLRRAALKQLTSLGYRVLEAEDADSAFKELNSNGSIDLLFTDVVMPGAMDGIDLAVRAAELNARLRILYASGFPDVRTTQARMATAHVRLLSKPYRFEELAKAVREALDTPML